jgi:hypothetical protein
MSSNLYEAKNKHKNIIFVLLFYYIPLREHSHNILQNTSSTVVFMITVPMPVLNSLTSMTYFHIVKSEPDIRL